MCVGIPVDAIPVVSPEVANGTMVCAAAQERLPQLLIGRRKRLVQEGMVDGTQ